MNSYLIVCTKLHKLDFIQDNKIEFEENTLFEDVLFHIKSMLKAQRISYNKKLLYNYRKNEDSTRQSRSLLTRDSFSIFHIYDEVKELLVKNNLYESFQLNFTRFVLTELENIYYNISDEYQEELYTKIKEYTSTFNLSESQVIQLPRTSRQFYEDIQNSENLFDFNLLNTLRIIDNTGTELIDKNELNAIQDILKQSSTENKNTIQLIENLVLNTNKAYKEIDYLTRVNKEMTTSHSWKLTKPLRWFITKIKKILKTRNTPTLTSNDNIESENKLFQEILKVNNETLDYNTVKEDIKDKCANINLTSNIDKLVTDKIYPLTKKNNKIRAEYENILYKHILTDIRNSSKKIESFNKIMELNLFDIEYYVKEYNYKLTIHPLLHYIYIGYMEGKNPSKKFDGAFYKRFNKNAGKSSLNPLVYFVQKGLYEGLVKTNQLAWQPLTVNRLELDAKINNFTNKTPKTEHTEKLVISLTTYPKRINNVKYTIYSLLNQTLPADEVVLWLSEKEFPNKEENLPEDLKKLQDNGLTIKWTSSTKSYKKLIPALKEYPNDIIITADDDLYYPSDWLETLYKEHPKDKTSIIAHRCKNITLDENTISDYNTWNIIEKATSASYTNFFTTGGGVLFPPNSLDLRVVDEKLCDNLCPYADDIWFWTMALLNHTKIVVPLNNIHVLTYTQPEVDVLNNNNSLWHYNKTRNNEQLDNVIGKFPEILDIIKE
ncbi:glycosyltransferase [Methanosphaera sp.]